MISQTCFILENHTWYQYGFAMGHELAVITPLFCRSTRYTASPKFFKYSSFFGPLPTTQQSIRLLSTPPFFYFFPPALPCPWSFRRSNNLIWEVRRVFEINSTSSYLSFLPSIIPSLVAPALCPFNSFSSFLKHFSRFSPPRHRPGQWVFTALYTLRMLWYLVTVGKEGIRLDWSQVGRGCFIFIFKSGERQVGITMFGFGESRPEPGRNEWDTWRWAFPARPRMLPGPDDASFESQNTAEMSWISGSPFFGWSMTTISTFEISFCLSLFVPSFSCIGSEQEQETDTYF